MTNNTNQPIALDTRVHLSSTSPGTTSSPGEQVVSSIELAEYDDLFQRFSEALRTAGSALDADTAAAARYIVRQAESQIRDLAEPGALIRTSHAIRDIAVSAAESAVGAQAWASVLAAADYVLKLLGS